jgi:hypothetical protein
MLALFSVSCCSFLYYNSVQNVKERVVSQVNVEAEQYLGTAMTYTLFEFVKEKMEDLLVGQPRSFVSNVTDVSCFSLLPVRSKSGTRSFMINFPVYGEGEVTVAM